MDSGSDNDSDGDATETPKSLMAILFGNIDSEGKLIDDDSGAYDSDLMENMDSLWHFEFATMVNDLVGYGNDATDDSGKHK